MDLRVPVTKQYATMHSSLDRICGVVVRLGLVLQEKEPARPTDIRPTLPSQVSVKSLCRFVCSNFYCQPKKSSVQLNSNIFLFVGLEKVLNIEDDFSSEVQLKFLPQRREHQLDECSEPVTNFEFKIQSSQSIPFSVIKYYRLDYETVEEFSFHGRSSFPIDLRFNGKTLTCFGNDCFPLSDGNHIPVLLLSIILKPQKGYAPSLNPMNYRFRGSYYSSICTGIINFLYTQYQ